MDHEVAPGREAEDESRGGPVRGMRRGWIVVLVLGIAATLLPALGAQKRTSARPSFGTWIAGLRMEALARKISPEILDHALARLKPIRRVVELDRRQPEFTLTL